MIHRPCDPLSPFGAAIHDRAGLTLGVSVFDFDEDVLPLLGADRSSAKHGVFVAIHWLIRPLRYAFPA